MGGQFMGHTHKVSFGKIQNDEIEYDEGMG